MKFRSPTSLQSRTPAGRMLLFALVVWSIGASALSAGDYLRVHLHDEKVLAGGVVRLRDIATVTGTNAAAIDRIGEVDIALLTSVSSQELIGRDRIQVRLLLAGYDGQSVAITGAEAVRVSYRLEETSVHQIGTATVESAAQAVLATTFGVSPHDVDARLAMPLELSIKHAGQPVTVDVLPPTNPQPGRMRLTLRIFIGDQLDEVTSGVFDVRLRQQVVLASASLPRGAVLTADSVRVQERWSTERVDSPSLPELGQWQARRPIPAGEPISTHDLSPVRPAQEQPAIRARDTVRLVARKGSLTVVVPAGEAMQSGQIGDMIQVRNLNSRKIIVGRVVSADEVEVRLY